MDAHDRAEARAHSDAVPDGCVLRPPVAGGRSTHLVAVLGVRAPVSVSGSPDQRVAAVANLQRGRISRGQLISVGISEGRQARMIARSALIREHRGVYRVGHCAPIAGGAETAALLACAPGTVLSHRSAAVLWGLLTDTPRVEVTVPDRQTGSPKGVVVHRSRTLLPRDVTIRNGLPVTSVARTLLDLAAALTARALERALDEALLTHLVTLAQLRDVLDRSVGRRGAGTLRAIVEREGPSARTHPGAEERFLALVRQSGLPAPEVNARIHGYEVDFLWRAQRVALEIDSWGFHRTRNAFERDRLKGARLSAAGVNVVRATGTQIEHEPFAVVVRMAQTLARAA